MYRLSQGPIATTLENKREPFLPVDGYGAEQEHVSVGRDKGSDWKPTSRSIPRSRDELMGIRSVVRKATRENMRQDLATLAKYPVLAPFIRALKTLSGRRGFYWAVPEGIRSWQPARFMPCLTRSAYADDLMRAYALLNEAADDFSKDDEEFAKYLRNRARDLLNRRL